MQLNCSVRACLCKFRSTRKDNWEASLAWSCPKAKFQYEKLHEGTKECRLKAFTNKNTIRKCSSSISQVACQVVIMPKKRSRRIHPPNYLKWIKHSIPTVFNMHCTVLHQEGKYALTWLWFLEFKFFLEIAYSQSSIKLLKVFKIVFRVSSRDFKSLNLSILNLRQYSLAVFKLDDHLKISNPRTIVVYECGTTRYTFYSLFVSF